MSGLMQLEAEIEWPRPPDRISLSIKAGEEFVVVDVMLDGTWYKRVQIKVEQNVGIVMRQGPPQAFSTNAGVPADTEPIILLPYKVLLE